MNSPGESDSKIVPWLIRWIPFEPAPGSAPPL